MRRFWFDRQGICIFYADEGSGWQFHVHKELHPFWLCWSSYGIDRGNAYARRRLLIIEWLWFHLWMDLGLLSVRRYRE